MNPVAPLVAVGESRSARGLGLPATLIVGLSAVHVVALEGAQGVH